MQKGSQYRQAKRLLVVMPTWLGDNVMATPTLRALRKLYSQAHITALVRSTVRPILEGCPWIDRYVTVRPRRNAWRRGAWHVGRQIAKRRFDTAVLLPNSFRSALLVSIAGIPRRVGYDRDGRGFLLTDRLVPRREKGAWVPVPTRDYYLGLARYLGAQSSDTTMQIFTQAEHDVAADRVLEQGGYSPTNNGPLIVMAPGATYGEAKMWLAQRFAAVADRCAQEFGATIALSGTANEKSILDAVAEAASVKMLNLLDLGIDLTLFKSVVKRSNLVITNDTGPRHVAAALGVPVVTIFGPTNPAWTEIQFDHERQVSVAVYCSPCQKKKCPLAGTPDDHACMRKIDPDMVFSEAAKLLQSVRASV